MTTTTKQLLLSATLAIVILLALALPALAQGPIIRVTPNGSDTADGTNWRGDAASLQRALSIATSGNEIWVAKGVYVPGSTRTDSFNLVPGVAMYGGFTGNETSRDQRDWETHLTVLSGDIGDNDTTDADGVVVTAADIVGYNAYHVIFADGSATPITSSTILDGLIITAGQATENGDFLGIYGGGLVCRASECSPTIHNVIFSGNIARYGGGMYANGTSSGNNNPDLSNVIFRGNTATENGGGILITNNSQATLTNVSFNGNTAEGYGGGMYNDSYSQYSSLPTLINVTFSGNSADVGGGGMTSRNSSPTLIDVTFNDNTARTYGGGMYNYSSSPKLTNVTFNNNSTVVNTGGGGAIYNHEDSSPELTNVIFSRNSSVAGGAMYNGLVDGSNNSPKLTNVTFSLNTAFQGGAMYSRKATPTLVNVIMWGNSTINNGSGNQIYNTNGASPLISYSLIQSGTNDIGGDCCSFTTWGTGILTDDPQFVDAANDNFHLKASSPAFDMGDISAVAGVSTDIEGNSRIEYGGVDLGAYEYYPCPAGGMVYVDQDATGTESGDSWADAYPSLQTGFKTLHTCGQVNEMWVAEGLYKPGAPGDALTSTFSLPAGEAIYGGFASAETSLDQRDWAAHPTVLSGDIGGDDTTDANGVVTDTANIAGSNVYHVVTADGTGSAGIDADTIFDGFIVTAGQATSTPEPADRGAGFFCNGAGSGSECSPTVSNVTFSGNTATYGGGMFNNGFGGGRSSPGLNYVTFSHNSAAYGGGVYNQGYQGTSLTHMDHVTFTNNSATVTADSLGGGGAMYNNGGGPGGNSSPTVNYGWFINNSAAQSGGAIINNGAAGGNSSPKLVNVLFTGNSAPGNAGGAIFHNADGSAGSVASLTNATFYGNSAVVGGGFYHFAPAGSSQVMLVNTIIWGNSASTDGNQVYNNALAGNPINLSYSLIKNDAGDITSSGTFNWGTGYLTSDPLFVDAAGGDLRLNAGSPARDSGNNSAVTAGSTDLDGVPRIQFDVVDMGAYEGLFLCPDSDVIYVDTDAGGTDSGASWTDAYPSLQSGIQAANDCPALSEVWVATGVYTPGATTADTFDLRAGVQVYGGFAAIETSRDQRDWVANPTILSGDIDGDDATVNGVVTHPSDISGSNARHVVTIDGRTTVITASTRLDGFIITGGQATGSDPDDRGAGVYCRGSGSSGECSPAVSHVTFRGNTAAYGAGMFNDGISGGLSSPALSYATFLSNTVTSQGGAIFNQGYTGWSHPTLDHVSFSYNSAAELGGAVFNQGGGAAGSSLARMSYITFTHNSAPQGGAMYNYGQSGGNSSPTITNATFLSNTATSNGGAIVNDGSSDGESNLTLVNGLFKGNSAPGNAGGAIFNNADGGNSLSLLTNATFYGNDANFGGALYNYGPNGGSGVVNMTNTIVWDNSATTGGNQLYNNVGTTALYYSLVATDTNDTVNLSGAINLLTGTMTVDPQFTNATGGDLRLTVSSPAIDAGDNSAVAGVPFDITGDTPRIQGGTVDLGAYEVESAGTPDLSITKVVTPSTVDVSAIVTYTVALRNSGSANDPTTSLTDTLPTGVDFARWIDQSGAAVTNDQITWSGTVTAGEAITLTFVATNTATDATVTNTVTFSGSMQSDSATAVYTATAAVETCTPSISSGTWSEVLADCATSAPDATTIVIPAGYTIILDQNIDLDVDLKIEPGGTFDTTTNRKTVTLTGGDDQTLTGDFTFYRLTVDKDNDTNTVTIDGSLTVASKLRVRSGELISASQYEDVEIEADGTLRLTNVISVSGHFTNSGTLTTDGWGIVFDGAKTQNLVLNTYTDFDDVTVLTGTLLVETVTNDNSFVNGTLTNYGTIRKAQTMDGPDFYYFGMAGAYPDYDAWGMGLEVTDLTGGDPLTAIQVDRIDKAHPNAPTKATGIYWTITPTGSDFTASVTLPHNNVTDPLACRYTGSDWDCANDDSDTDYVTYLDATTFSDWAVFETQLTAVDDPAITTQEDVAVIISPLANDIGVGSSSLSLNAVDTPEHGTATISGTTQVVYTPALNFYGTDSFTYIASDGTLTDTATITVSVSAVNDAPHIIEYAWTQVGSAGFSAGGAQNTSLALDGSDTPYVTYMDDANSRKASVMTFNGTDWEQVGSAGFSPGSASYTSLAFDSSDTPYVAYQDGGNDSKASVMKFNGTAWEQVGIAGFSAGAASYISLALDSNDTPYVAYMDSGNSNKASVMKFNGTAWEQVGSAGFSAGQASYTSLAVDGSDTPYVAYMDSGNSNKASVMKFNGTAWEQVGSAGFSTGTASYTSLTVDGSDTPYVAYKDSGNSNKVSVMKFNGTAWEQVGSAGFSAGGAQYTSLALDGSDTPYVGYMDGGNSNKASVMKFNGTAWEQVGIAGFSAGTSQFLSLALDSNDTPYVAYKDGDNSSKASVMKLSQLTNVTMSENGDPTPYAQILEAVDPDDDTLTWSISSGANHGTALANGTGITKTIAYTPDNDYAGTDSFVVQVSDGVLTDTAIVSVTIKAVNDAPVITDSTPISVTMSEDGDPTAFSLTLHATDGDPSDTLTWSIATQPVSGTATASGTGSSKAIGYTPPTDWHGTTVFSVSVTDGITRATVPVSVTVQPVKDAPKAVDDAVSTDEDTPLTISPLSNDTDPDGDSLKLVAGLLGSPGHGTATISGTTQVIYTPTLNFTGSDVFTYTATDGSLSDTAAITVTVTASGVNAAPLAVDDPNESTSEDTPLTISPLSNDSDPNGDTLSLSTVGIPAHGTAAINGSTQLVYTPTLNYNGADVFTYTATDGSLSDTATITVTVNAVNDQPVANPDSLTTQANQAKAVDVLANDTDADNDTLSVVDLTQPLSGTASLSGTLVLYRPQRDYKGSDSFAYTVSDGQGGTAQGTVTVTVQAINHAPSAITDSVTLDEDTPVAISVLANDSDPDGDTVRLNSVGSPAHGTAVISGSQVLYTPALNYNGADSFTYIAGDGNGGVDSALVQVTITPVTDAPAAIDDAFDTAQDVAITVSPTANDLDPDNVGLCVVDIGAAQGTATKTGCDVNYTPPGGFTGFDSFTYTLQTGAPASAHGNVTIIVGQPKVVATTADTDTTAEDTAITLSVLANDTNGGALKLVGVNQPSNGQVVISGDKVTYTPDTNFNGTDTFTYTVTDTNGWGQDLVTVTVTPVNDNPVAVKDQASTDEEKAVDINLLANDTDVDTGQTLTITAVTDGLSGQVVDKGSGMVTYTPQTDFVGSDSFTYTLSDGAGGQSQGLVEVTVRNVNDAPVAAVDVIRLDEDGSRSFDPLANDWDADGDPLSLTAVGQPAHGSLSGSGPITYTADADWSGTDSFTYTVSDGVLSDTATVTVTVSAVNDAPVITDSTPVSVTMSEDGSPTAFSLTLHASDPDPADTLAWSIASQPISGTATASGAGGSKAIGYNPPADWFGSTTFIVKVSDESLSDTIAVSVTVKPVNDAPVAVDDPNESTSENTPLTISPLSNDSDVENDTLQIAMVGSPTKGTASISGTTQVVYTPTLNYSGADSFLYTVSDGQLTDFGTITVTVNSVNNGPVLTDSTPISVTMSEDGSPTAFSLTLHASDGDTSDTLTWSIATQPVSGTATAGGTGITKTIGYTPPTDWHGTTVFTVAVSDGTISDTVVVSVTVEAVNDAPVAVDDPNESTSENTSVTISPLGNDTDVENDTLRIAMIGSPTHGTVSISGTTQVVYTPTLNYSGADSFLYTVSDGQLTDFGTITVTVNSVNDAPLAVDDSVLVRRDDNGGLSILATQPVTIPVLLNDSDPSDGVNDSSGLTLSAVGSGSQGGTVAINSNSLWVDYTPTSAFTGTETFTYTARDSGGLTATATVTVTVVNGDGGGSTNPGNGGGQTITIPNTGDSGAITVTITLPGGGTDTLTVVYNELTTPSGQAPQGYVLAGLSFTLEAYLNQQLQAGYVFSSPITLTLTYSDADVEGLSQGEESLELWHWDGSQWTSDGITVTNRVPESNQLTVIVDRSGEYALLGGGMNFIYLPLLAKKHTTAPDLVITGLTASGSSVSVTVQNQGSAPVADAFWVDVYFDPSQPPTVNQPWPDLAPAGLVWGVTRSLSPGESLTLTSGGAYFDAGQSSSPPFAVGATVYGYVDSVDFSSSTGAVLESSEANNLAGPKTVTAGGSAAASAGNGAPVEWDQLPGR